MTRTWKEPPGEWIGEPVFTSGAGEPTFDDPQVCRELAMHYLEDAIDYAVELCGFGIARDRAVCRFSDHAGSRPVVIDHIQETH